MVKICFICLGNICRSPMAEALMREEVKQRGWEDKVLVESAATGDWNLGSAPHPGTANLLAAKGISTDNMYASLLKAGDVDRYDYLIGMDDSNIKNIEKIVGTSDKVYQLLDFTDQAGPIADPYYTGNFDLTYDLVTKGIQGLCQHLEATYPELRD
ncbi:low molecular weight protein-tyrosine-phosphatase [Aerococcus sanguinicola]|uniref:protein-tyrosine-phosphatase n=1 Tax=Aerococcus sanguinicola TaxID=119206 RepID=A0A0X8FAM0_9LACT|nr:MULTISPECIES: low molecular weight protein-tyrosine-phosphatase [Aerococcus]AMB93660.1 hypothetical protein AWM72_02265 [Aerococcus sanguinicola]MDK7050997.1 low molecular weight protein-tyrosine-phosphatase [Aerococcus sanguinicola]OFT95330.1 hypothetical protein HMPREF3090_04590 [Aerococcus sp. HMSC23C02]PKZ21612.1 low molecular weight phosphotyrosine protein phosphatase [Aerococcus sanguinicola]